jgi:hypothetical protein
MKITRKNKMKYLLCMVGHLWMLPNTIASALYLCAFRLLGWVEYKGTTDVAILLTVPQGTWLDRKVLKGRWGGWAAGAFIVVREPYINSITLQLHEERHIKQQMIFGIFQPVLYLLSGLAMVIVGKHFYRDNPFEVDARKAAR